METKVGALEGQLWCKVLICGIWETFKALKIFFKSSHMRVKKIQTFLVLSVLLWQPQPGSDCLFVQLEIFSPLTKTVITFAYQLPIC